MLVGDKMGYKMVVLDLDGTLLDDAKKISEKNIQILTRLHEKNVEIVIATGRNYYMAKTLTEKIKHVKPVILANNGAIARCSYNDELLDHNYLNPLVFEEIYYEGLKMDLYPVVHVDEFLQGYDLVFENEDYENTYLGYIKKDYNRARQMKFNPKSMDRILAVVYFNDYNKLCSFATEMKNSSNGRFNTICNRNLSHRALLEFLHPEGCKWKALSKYASGRGISTEDIIAIGDDNNDIELLKNCGLGIAMKNGTLESICAANTVTEHSNNDSGVYYALTEIFQGL
jgi:Cof subfamily protein (haloacid dehalogenase superfamily)